jgi:hypothetical protein
MDDKDYTQTNLDKTLDFFRRNLYNFILVIVSAIFIFKDIIQIKETGKSVLEIVADSLISFVMAMTFNIILGKKGLLAAQNLESYRDCMRTYSDEIEKTNDKIEYLEDYCEYKNNNKLRLIQKRILTRVCINYDDFINGRLETYNLNKAQKKALKKVERISFHYLTPENILSETDARFEKGKKDLTLAEFEKSQNFQDTLSKIIIAVIFGYFGVGGITGGLAEVLWGSIQIGLWLIMGLCKYIQNYSYVKDVYQQKIYRKINLLIEFNNSYIKTKKKGESLNGNNNN